jgi:hypothetical protein
LDPGHEISIDLIGGLAIRPKEFVVGHPPRIEIDALPAGASVNIGGEQAHQGKGGGWEAAGWDLPGRHTVDVVPGPSLTYEIAGDPAQADGWPFWNAHEKRFRSGAPFAWAQAQICGARVMGPAGQTVIAAETEQTLIALVSSNRAVVLQSRPQVSVSVGLAPDPPSFLLSAWGRRRAQGRVLWLGLGGTAPTVNMPQCDPDWVAAVQTAARRGLRLEEADEFGDDAWRRAKERARRLRKLSR